MSRHYRTLLLSTVLASVLIVFNSSGSALAGADPNDPTSSQNALPESPSGSFTLGSGDGSVTPNLASGSVGGAICTLNVQYPHKSTHVPSTINVIGGVSCTGTPPAKMSLTISLYKWGHCTPTCTWYTIAVGATKTNYNSSTISANAAGPCVNGTYEGYGNATITAPPGSTPAVLYLYGATNSANTISTC